MRHEDSACNLLEKTRQGQGGMSRGGKRHTTLAGSTRENKPKLASCRYQQWPSRRAVGEGDGQGSAQEGRQLIDDEEGNSCKNQAEIDQL